jgi:hypothetical protein
MNRRPVRVNVLLLVLQWIVSLIAVFGGIGLIICLALKPTSPAHIRVRNCRNGEHRSTNPFPPRTMP